MSDLESVDALIAAAKKSLRQRRGNDVAVEPEQPAPAPDRQGATIEPSALPTRSRPTPDLPDGVADAVTAAVAAALQGLSFETQPASAKAVDDEPVVPFVTDPDEIDEILPPMPIDEPIVDAAAELEAPAPSTGSRFDLVDGLIGRIDAAVKFVRPRPAPGRGSIWSMG